MSYEKFEAWWNKNAGQYWVSSEIGAEYLARAAFMAGKKASHKKTLRDEFATAAVSCCMITSSMFSRWVAEYAYQVADEMLKRRKNG